MFATRLVKIYSGSSREPFLGGNAPLRPIGSLLRSMCLFRRSMSSLSCDAITLSQVQIRPFSSHLVQTSEADGPLHLSPFLQGCWIQASHLRAGFVGILGNRTYFTLHNYENSTVYKHSARSIASSTSRQVHTVKCKYDMMHFVLAGKHSPLWMASTTSSSNRAISNRCTPPVASTQYSFACKHPDCGNKV